MPTPERRRQERTRVRVPVKVRPQTRGAPECSGETRDLSSSGVFLYSDSALEAGTKLDLVIMLPGGIGLGPGGWTLCQASVVRVEKSDDQRMGVAATLDRIERLPELS